MADGDKFKSPKRGIRPSSEMSSIHPTSRQGRGGEYASRNAVNRYYAFKAESTALFDVMASLDRLNIAYEYFGESNEWSVLEIQGFVYSPPHRRTYEAALNYAKTGDEY